MGATAAHADPEPVPRAELSFDDWFRDVWPALVTFLRVVLRDAADAEDVASDACVKVMHRWDSDPLDDPRAWAFAVASRIARRRLGRRRDFASLDLDLPAHVGADGWDPEVVEAIKRLPARQRTAIGLRYVADLSQSTVAAAMGIADGTAAALLHQGRENLRRRLGATDD